MPVFNVRAPNGTTYTVNGPEGSTIEDAYAYVQSRLSSAGLDPSKPFSEDEALRASSARLWAENSNPVAQVARWVPRAVGGLMDFGGSIVDAAQLDSAPDFDGRAAAVRDIPIIGGIAEKIANVGNRATQMGNTAFAAGGRAVAAGLDAIGMPSQAGDFIRAGAAGLEQDNADALAAEERRRAAAGLPTLAEENASKTMNFIGRGISKGGKWLTEKSTSDESRANAEDFGRAFEGGASSVGKFIATDPGAAIDAVAPSMLEMLAPGGIVGRIGKGALMADAIAGGERAAARVIASGGDELMAEAARVDAIVSGTIRAERGARDAVVAEQVFQTSDMNARQARDAVLSADEAELQKNPEYAKLASEIGAAAAREEIARRVYDGTFSINLPIAAATTAIPARAGMMPVEMRVAGAAERGGLGASVTGVKGRLARAAVHGAKEAAGETVQEAGDQLAGNIAGVNAGTSDSYSDGIGAAAVAGAAIGFVPGSISGAATRPETRAGISRGEDILAAAGVGLSTPSPAKPAAPVQAAGPAAPAPAATISAAIDAYDAAAGGVGPAGQRQDQAQGVGQNAPQGAPAARIEAPVARPEIDPAYTGKPKDELEAELAAAGVEPVVQKPAKREMKASMAAASSAVAETYPSIEIRPRGATFDYVAPTGEAIGSWEGPKLSEREQAVEARAAAQVLADPAAAVAAYRALPGVEGGRVINTDEAREIFPEYSADASARSANALAVHEPSSFVAKRVWQEELARPVGEGREPTVMFMAGGTGAGKTSSIERIGGEVAHVRDVADIIYDGNLNGTSSAKKKIDEALASGREVYIAYIARDPVDAFEYGAIPRANMENYGRTVPMHAHVNTHVGSAKTILELEKIYADDPRVKIEAYRNQTGMPPRKIAVSEVEKISKLDYNSVEKLLNERLEVARNEGRVSDRVWSYYRPAQAEAVQRVTEPAVEGGGKVDSPRASRREEEGRGGQEEALTRDVREHALRLQRAVSTALAISRKGKDGRGVRVFRDAAHARSEGFNVEDGQDGFYDPNTDTAGLIASEIQDVDRALWVAWHEHSAHRGLRSALGDDPAVTEELKRAAKNPVVRALADAIKADRNDPGMDDMLAVEEALAELQAAVRTGNYAEISDRYGVDATDIKSGQVRAVLARIMRAIRAAISRLGGRGSAYSNDEVMALLEDAHSAAAKPAGEGSSATSLSSTRAASRNKTSSVDPSIKYAVAKDGSVKVVDGIDAAKKIFSERGLTDAGVMRGGALYFSPNQSPRIIAALSGEDNATSRGGAIYDHVIRDGKIVGAPPGFDTPARLPALRKRIESLAEDGRNGRMWYENSGRMILRMLGGSVADAKKFMQLLAIYSPQTDPKPNYVFALRAWFQIKAGVPVSVKTGVQDKTAERVVRDGGDWSGEKTNNFYRNLMREVDPKNYGAEKQGVTGDMWMARAFGYYTDAPNDSQYRFIEIETNRLAKKLGWEPQQAQAAVWVALKARMNGDNEANRAVDRKSIEAGDLVIDNGIRTFSSKQGEINHRKRWIEDALKRDISESAMLKGEFDFSDAVKTYSAQISWEARPGRTAGGDMQWVNDAPYDVQAEYQEAIAAALKDGDKDLLAAELGLPMASSINAPGVWQSEVSAGSQNIITLPLRKGGVKEWQKMLAAKAAAGETITDEDRNAVDPTAQRAVTAYAAILGRLLRQEGVGWHKPDYATSARDANGIELVVGRPLTDSEVLVAYNAIDSKLTKAGHSINDVAFVSSPTGLRLINFTEMPNPAFARAVSSAISGDTEISASIDLFRVDGALVGNDWEKNQDGQDYLRAAAEAGHRSASEWADRVLAPRIAAANEAFAKRHGRTLASKRRGSDAGRDRRDGDRVAVGAQGEGWSERPVQRDAVTITGVHYSNTAGLKSLDGTKYGSNHKGAEWKRIDNALWYDEEKYAPIANRVYFYPSDSALVGGESMVRSSNRHEIVLSNIYDLTSDPRGLGEKFDSANDLELAIIDEGFDGYRTESMAVVLGTKPIPTRPTLASFRPYNSKGFGRAVAAEKRARATLGWRAKDALERWQLSNWATGELARDVAVDGPISRELREAFAPVREALRAEFGDSVPLHRGVQAGSTYPADRRLYSWTINPEAARGFATNRRYQPKAPATPAEVEAAIAQYERTGYTSFRGLKYKRNSEDPRYYDIYDGSELLTDGEDIRKEIESRNEWLAADVAEVAAKGSVTEANIPLDQILWLMPLSQEVIVDVGAPTRASIAREDQTKTEAFRKWFGDSKVVDSDGNPLLVYHGTNNSFDTFNTSWLGAFFSSSQVVAAEYGSETISAYVALENPLIVDARGADWSEIRYTPRLRKLAKEAGVVFAGYDGGFIDIDTLAKIARVAGYDGLLVRDINDAPGFGGSTEASTVVVAFRPEQIKSATANNGNFDPSNPSILASKAAATATPARIENVMDKQKTKIAAKLKDRAIALNKLAASGISQGSLLWDHDTKKRDSASRVLRRTFHDRMIDARDIVDEIERASGAAVADTLNLYQAENLMHGKATDRIEVLRRKFVDPLKEAIKKSGLSNYDVHRYLWARHAEERNKRIAKINPAMQDGGSGLSTEEATKILSEIRSSANRSALDEIDRRVKNVRDYTLDTLVGSGQITAEQAKRLRDMYSHYVPLRGKADGEGEARTMGFGGRGLDQRGKPFERALGRSSEPSNILGELVGDAERAAVQSAKAEVGLVLLRMALRFPNKGVWVVEPVTVEPRFSEATGEVYMAVVSSHNDADTVIVRHNGKPYAVRIVDKRLREAVTAYGVEGFEAVAKALGWANRWFSAVLTRYNPSFVGVNMIRDAIFGTTAVASELGGKALAEVVSLYPKAMAAMWSAANGNGDSSVPDSKKSMVDWAREFSESGAKTGFSTFEDAETIQSRIENEMATIGDLIREKKPATAISQALQRSTIVQTVERANDAVENAMRLAAYVQQRKAGVSPAKAAQYAKNITVNFNRRGTATGAMNALYLFFNASIQGAHRTLQLLSDPRVLAGLGATAAAQAAIALTLGAAKYEDDEETLWEQIPDYVRERAFVIPLGFSENGDPLYVAIPMPYGFNLATAAAGYPALVASPTWRARQPHGPAATLVNGITRSAIDAFSVVPIGEDGWYLPTIARMQSQFAANKDDLGNSIRSMAAQRGDGPRASAGKADTPEIYRDIAVALNRIGGGDEFTKPINMLDVAPEDIEYVIGKMTGGLGGTIQQAVRFGGRAAAGQEIMPGDVPIASRIVGSQRREQVVAKQFFETSDRMEEGLDRLRRAFASGGLDEFEAEKQRLGAAFSGVAIARYRRTDRKEGYSRGQLRIDRETGRPTFVAVEGSVFKKYKDAKEAADAYSSEVRLVYGDESIGSIDRSLSVEDAQRRRAAILREFLLDWSRAAQE